MTRTLTGVWRAIIDDAPRAIVVEEWGVLSIGVATADLGAALILATAAGPDKEEKISLEEQNTFGIKNILK